MSHSLFATHIRAGEITVKRLYNQTLTFEFTFTGFRDTGSIIEFGDGKFDFGDGTYQERGFEITKQLLGNDVEMIKFKLTHTYQAPNSYVVSYEEKFRNADIINMDNSVNTTFYVESMLVIDPFFGLNNTPTFTVPPIDYAAVGALFIHNPGAFDEDGDSLSYKFTIPKQGRGAVVNNYRVMNDPEFYENYSQGNEAQNNTPGLTINPVTGDLIWDAPGDVLNQGDKAEYNVAFVIEEWRKVAGEWFKMGYVTRDMQIIVEKSDNNRPEITVPENVCVEAGNTVKERITATDIDGDPIKIEAFGGPFEVNGSKAKLIPDIENNYQNSPAFIDFEWTTECGHVRLRPYEVQFKATDKPAKGHGLVDFKSFEITVVGPAPQGLKTNQVVGRSIEIEWDQYICTNAEKMEIWRRVGSFDVEIDECTIGMPANTGYRKIDEVNLWDDNTTAVTAYTDNNNGRGLSPGGKYCYRLVAVYQSPEGGKSYVSAEVCDSLIIDAPVITNVDILETSETSGQIRVNWTPPYQINQTIHPPAYTYDVVRAEGASPGKPYTTIASKISDTTFVDTGLNTYDKDYHYFIRLYDGNDFLTDSSATASNVALKLNPLLKSIRLNWSADVPWSNTVEDFPYHYIYRSQVLSGNESELVLIDSVNVTKSGYTYLDDGRFNKVVLDEDIEYCYFVTAMGSYDSKFLPEPLRNRSQISCGQPNDTIPPCSPPEIVIENRLNCAAILASKLCGVNTYTQNLDWSVDTGPDCDDDIDHYNIYYTSTGKEEDYELIGTSPEETFAHENITSIKGCYKITSVDRSGNESEFSNEICNDNCPVYKLPNIFTPNNDGINDVFTPLYPTGLNASTFQTTDCPRFVRRVIFKVYDRSGVEVFQYDSYENENGIYINWDGKNKWGIELATGVYFYSAEVDVDVLDPNETKWNLNGWIHLMR